ncbi:hypothetical protein MPDQ_004777 [Monascus purpureus]|uniref:AB hydrolase-1 domain-containing protein n=1 Tax=Monascus purpureus TaxID=5098 RepID=A0A507QXE4_MONPU|nr:hypothetical protein MPDQ_004777 [Monascus purpureus]BDD62878.1 hypothetical protein MAP00_007832 [Monascus purpureus]
MPFFKPDDDSPSLFYVLDGPSDGTPILLLHGWTCDLHDWIFQVPFLNGLGFQTIAVDQRGHGHSSVPDSDYEVETFANDAARLLEHLKIPSAIVAGHAMGAIIASWLAVQHAEKVKALILVDPIYSNPAEYADKYLATPILDLEAPEDIRLIFKDWFYPPETPKWLIQWHTARAAGLPFHVMKDCTTGLFRSGRSLAKRENATAHFADRGCPRLVVGGSSETVSLDEELPKTSKDRIEVLEGGHFLHQQRSEEFNGIVRDWLAQIDLLP